jgi:hypothetical protein
MKQTAVNYLADKVSEIIGWIPQTVEQEKALLEALEEAKEMEEEQSLKMQPYDLDELAMEYSEGKSTSEVFKKAHESDFKAGFQKALELLTLKNKIKWNKHQ